MENKGKPKYPQIGYRRSLEENKQLLAEELFMQYLFDEGGNNKKLHLNDRVKKLNRDFPELMETPEILEIYGAVQENLDWINISAYRAKEYCERLLEGFPECLYPNRKRTTDWFLFRLHDIVRYQSMGILGSLGGYVKEVGKIKIHFEKSVFPLTRKDEIKKSLLAKLERQWKKIEGNPEYVRKVKPKENLEESVKWLCDCIFNGDTATSIFNRLVKSSKQDWKYISIEYIDQQIRELANLLGISRARGRPTRAKIR